jgi:hypothetical protein
VDVYVRYLRRKIGRDRPRRRLPPPQRLSRAQAVPTGVAATDGSLRCRLGSSPSRPAHTRPWQPGMARGACTAPPCTPRRCSTTNLAVLHGGDRSVLGHLGE